MYEPYGKKRSWLDPVILAASMMICLILVLFLYGYIVAIVTSILVVILIMLLIFMILFFVFALVITPIYYMFKKTEVEEHTSYSLGSVRGAEDTLEEKKGKI